MRSIEFAPFVLMAAAAAELPSHVNEVERKPEIVQSGSLATVLESVKASFKMQNGVSIPFHKHLDD